MTHFLRYGLAEGRAPGPGFDPDAYLKAHPDVARAGQNALAHYLLFGEEEGRGSPSLTSAPILPWGGQVPGAAPAGMQRILYVLSIQSGGTPQT
ncbi:MAG: hypothetical protein L0J56_09890, partial [Halomonas sp.]|nr:hypothetical protein [Halomonas sp.]